MKETIASIKSTMTFASAAGRGDLEVVRNLVEQGVNIHTNYEEALCRSAGNGHLEVVRYLVEQGANVRAFHYTGNTPLNEAVRYGHFEVVKYLINQGAKINNDMTYNEMYYSVITQRLDILKYLHENGGDLHDGILLYLSAYVKMNYEISKYLIDNGVSYKGMKIIECNYDNVIFKNGGTLYTVANDMDANGNRKRVEKEWVTVS